EVHHFQDGPNPLARTGGLIRGSSAEELAICIKVPVLEEIKKVDMAIGDVQVCVAFLSGNCPRHATHEQHASQKTSPSTDQHYWVSLRVWGLKLSVPFHEQAD